MNAILGHNIIKFGFFLNIYFKFNFLRWKQFLKFTLTAVQFYVHFDIKFCTIAEKLLFHAEIFRQEKAILQLFNSNITLTFEISLYTYDTIDQLSKSNILQKLTASGKFFNVLCRCFLYIWNLSEINRNKVFLQYFFILNSTKYISCSTKFCTTYFSRTPLGIRAVFTTYSIF